MKAITAFMPDAPPRRTFTVIVSTLNIPGHPYQEYTVETFYDHSQVSDFVAIQEGKEVARSTNMGALLNALLEVEGD